jgi:hypothetical protein
MSSTNVGELKLENTDIKTAPGVDLNSEQRTLISSVLDLFAGRPSLAKLQLWKDDAVFSDPITVAKGRKEFEPQWVSSTSIISTQKKMTKPSNDPFQKQYGLQTAFSEIERKSHSVTSAGNPIEMDMTTMYKVKGLGKETTITSKVNIFHEGGKITRVEDKWDGKLPDSGIVNVSRSWTNAVDPRFSANYWLGWGYSLLVAVHDSWWWMVRDRFLFFLSSGRIGIASSYHDHHHLPRPSQTAKPTKPPKPKPN